MIRCCSLCAHDRRCIAEGNVIIDRTFGRDSVNVRSVSRSDPGSAFCMCGTDVSSCIFRYNTSLLSGLVR